MELRLRLMQGLVILTCVCVWMSACGGGESRDAQGSPEPADASSPTESPEPVVPEVADGEIAVTGKEWSFSAPSQVVAGPTRITLDNVGTLSHELVMVEPEAGRSLADIRLLPHVDAMASVRWIAGSGLVHEGQVSRPLQVDLRPGTYGFLCMLDGPGQTHAKTGMFLEFEVVSA